MTRTNRPDADAERRDWVIEKVVPGGDGMAHLSDGRVGFASGAFPGDTIRPLAVEAKKGHVRATRFDVVSPGPDRVTPPCPVVDTCGGCDFMALGRSAQLARKEELLRGALERIGGFTSLPEGLTVVGVAPELRYRSRVRFHVDAAGRLGFYARGSHSIVEVPGCLTCRPEIDSLLVALRAVPKDSLAALSEIDVRVADEGVKASVRLVPRFPGGAGPALKVVVSRLPRDVVVTIDGESPSGVGEQRFPLPGGTYLLAEPGVFTQVNWPVNVALVEAVVGGARARGVTRFLDAYAGAGNFSIPLLHAGMHGVSVELDVRAVECARRAATAQGLSADGFVAGEAETLLEGLARKKESFDLVLLDPPRSGAREVLRSVQRLGPRTVAFCSCDPVTLSRDLATLARAGYRLDEVRGFDMFPSTHHLETMAWMSRPT